MWFVFEITDAGYKHLQGIKRLSNSFCDQMSDEVKNKLKETGMIKHN
jgi:hypothetical protein